MTIYEAYLIAKSDAVRNGKTRLWACSDYGDFWGFLFGVPVPGHDYPVPGEGDITVNKETGNVGFFAPITDLDLLDKAKHIPIEQFTEYNVAV